MALIVVRTQGERTEGVCIELAQAQFERVEVVRVSPFIDAVRECFRIGIASGEEWLFMIDADVQIAADYRERIAPYLGSAWQVIGRIDDLLFGDVRQGGVRAYRVDALPDAMTKLRPARRVEADLCKQMPGWLDTPVLTGRHDYEQWYRDLHRKGSQHRDKHPYWRRRVASRWKGSADADLRAAYAGWCGEPLDMIEKGPL